MVASLELVGSAEVELITEVVESIVVATSLEPVGSVDVVTSSELLVRYIPATLDEACGPTVVVDSIKDVESVEVEITTEIFRLVEVVISFELTREVVGSIEVV